MAVAMTEEGAKKAAAGHAGYSNWSVSVDDILQWIGVWLYMLAYPQVGARAKYWEERKGGYGPRHRLAEHLKLGSNGNGVKGRKWFEQMHACFTLPVKTDERAGATSEEDPFKPVRRFWDSLCESFHNAVVCSWLMVLEESMVQWEGRGMPGLMAVARKPTPVGLELHTLCCGLCGILLWFEVYEGKEAMARKKYNDLYTKSIALTLRMCEPFFGSVMLPLAASARCVLLMHHASYCWLLDFKRVLVMVHGGA
mmetsp:Transcript_56077/g.122080  ORF Transcript_56077/g.122080 Transcript_56077/m.122080 type:complete len:253 (+) Transcript_56077:606-1364(+)